jgi:ribonuclease E
VPDDILTPDTVTPNDAAAAPNDDTQQTAPVGGLSDPLRRSGADPVAAAAETPAEAATSAGPDVPAAPRRRRAAGRPSGPPTAPAPPVGDLVTAPSAEASTETPAATTLDDIVDGELDEAAAASTATDAVPPEPAAAGAGEPAALVEAPPAEAAQAAVPQADIPQAEVAEPARRTRARRAVRAVLAPAVQRTSAGDAPAEAPDAQATDAQAVDTQAANAQATDDQGTATEATDVHAADAEAAGDQGTAAEAADAQATDTRAAGAVAEPAGVAESAAPPTRRRARATRRVASAPEAAEAPVPAAEAPSAGTDEVSASGPPPAAEPAAAPKSRRRRARPSEPAAVSMADQDTGAAEPATAAEDAPADVVTTEVAVTEVVATGAATQEPATKAPSPASRSTPQWSARAQPFSTGFGEETVAPRVVRRAVTTVTFQAPDLAARESAPRGRDRDAEPRGRESEPHDGESEPRDREREQRPARAVRKAEQPEPEQPAQIPVAADLGTADTEAGLPEEPETAEADTAFDDADVAGTRRRRRGRRGRGRARGEDELDTGEDAAAAEADEAATAQADEDADEQLAADQDEQDEDEYDDRAGSRRRRRRRRRTTTGEETGAPDDPPNTVVHVREARRDDDLVRGVSGSTRLEAKRQRRREGRDSGRRRPPIVTEAEFLARRESVERRMLVRNAGDRTQIAVLEDGVLVEHFVTRASSASYAGNVYLGRVQNVLASMEAAFVDIGKGRNAVLYAGEVNYDASGLEGRPRKIEQVLKPGQSVLVQVSKDPIGHKGARLTSQISLPGRYLVYVPDGQNAGISRKLPDVERSRLKSILKKITPEDGGVIVRTAAEGASEQELERDVERLAAQWEDITRKSQRASAPSLLYGEPDLVVRVIRDVFNEDFTELLVQGSGEAETIESYVDMVAPDLRTRVRRHVGLTDLFTEYRVDEQLAKALDRKVWLPSGGSLVIDRTEAMTVIDVNTGKFTGKGGNLEETVTKNNLEAAEEIVRQLRLRDIGGIIVIDFIDMVLESNRELVLRRLTECLGRDRTRHQVAEVTSLGLVQMTRKRVGQGLLEAYSEPCAHCNGRGVIIHLDGHHVPPPAVPVPAPPPPPPPRRPGRRGAAAPAETELAESPVAETDVADEPAVTTAGTDEHGAGDAGAAREGRRTRRARRAASPVIAAVPEAPVAVASSTGDEATRTQGTGWPGDAAAGGAEAPGEPGGVGWPTGAGLAVPAHGGAAQQNGTTVDQSGPTVFANSADPDSIAVGSESGNGRGRRPRRASRPVAKPAESVEAGATAE